MRKTRLAAVLGGALAFVVIWALAPALIVVGLITDWDLSWIFTQRSWIALAIGLVVSAVWCLLTRSWLAPRVDKVVDRAMDWAQR